MYLGGDSRLAKMQLFSSSYITAVLRHRLKCRQLMQVECTHAVTYETMWEHRALVPDIAYILSELTQQPQEMPGPLQGFLIVPFSRSRVFCNNLPPTPKKEKARAWRGRARPLPSLFSFAAAAGGIQAKGAERDYQNRGGNTRVH